jgi:ribonuclease BN (tRNA processing enzyme)
MRLTVIGCSGSYPGPDSAASCYLLEAEHPERPERPFRLLLDLGSGALGPLQRHIDPLTVDAILVTHLHADHFFDISGYFVLRKYHPNGCAPRIPVYGPRTMNVHVAQAYGLPPEPGMNAEFDFHELEPGPLRVGPFAVTAGRVDHPVEAYGFRIEHGDRVLTYSGDTAPCTALVELAREADLLLVEASFRDGADNPPHLHMTGSEAGALASEAAARQVVLTHIPPWHDKQDAVREARTAYPGPVALAAEGSVFEL